MYLLAILLHWLRPINQFYEKTDGQSNNSIMSKNKNHFHLRECYFEYLFQKCLYSEMSDERIIITIIGLEYINVSLK